MSESVSADRKSCHCELPIARGAKRGGRNKGSWIPGRARLRSLARNDGRRDGVIPAKAGIQEAGHVSRHFVSEQELKATKQSRFRAKIASLRSQ